jgi:hypothetical protein
MAKTENVPTAPLRALTMFKVIPAGCIQHPVTNNNSAPHLLASFRSSILPTPSRKTARSIWFSTAAGTRSNRSSPEPV